MPCIARAFFPGLILLASTTQAGTLLWPDPTSVHCNTTLQACIDTTTDGDTVQVRTDSADVGQLVVNNAISLVAAPGHRPVLAAGNTITGYHNPGDGIAWSMTIEGFTLLDGFVYVDVLGGAGTVNLRHLDVTTLTGPSWAGLDVRNGGVDPMHYTLANNRIRIATGRPAIVSDVTGSGKLIGSIHDNRIEALGQAQSGILLLASDQSVFNIYANQILDASVGIDILAETNNVTYSANVVSNLITCKSNQPYSEGIFAQPSQQTLTLDVLNNTILGCAEGFSSNGGSKLVGRLTNNLIADSADVGVIIDVNSTAFTNNSNLLFANAVDFNPYGAQAGPNTVTSDPLFVRGIDNPRLSAQSPAVDAADTAALQSILASVSLPEIDADGLRRFKGNPLRADIGAFEYGDNGVIAIASTTGSVIRDASLTNNANAFPLLTQNKVPDGYEAMATNPLAIAVRYLSSYYSVVNDDGTAPVSGSAYNAFIPAAGSGSMLQTSSAASVVGFYTELDDPYINGHPERIVLANQREASLFDHPLGLTYLGQHWFIAQLDAQTGDPSFPLGVQFDIYAQDESVNAFNVTVLTASPLVSIDHLLLNGEPCGRIYVSNDKSDPHPIEVDYRGQNWTIVNADGAGIPAFSVFHVIVDEAATAACRYDHIFHDGFEKS
jgi:hypothetical protein